MKIGILSDTHNEIANTRAALAIFKAREVEFLIHCGDLTNPDMVSLFQGWRVAFVYGNIDKKQGTLARAVAAAGGLQTIGAVFQNKLDGVRIGACHGHENGVLESMVISGEYDLVLHGHFHVRKDEKVNSTRVLSPGALGGTYHEPRSICIYDLGNGTADMIEIARYSR